MGKRKCSEGQNSSNNRSGHRNGKTSRLEVGANDLHPFTPITNKHGKYIPVCSFSGHQGILGKLKARRCERKRCIYLRYYSEGVPPYYDDQKASGSTEEN